MPKKKQKKGADKEKKAKKKPWMNERETVSYEQQILDNNKQLERLRSRNEHLESEVDALKEELNKLEEDRSDVVALLKRILQQKIEEARELNERLLAMEELRKEEQIAYKKKEESMRAEYNTMETNLTAEVKLATGKLNALEDWRLARIDLMKKFEIQEEQMAEQEERHKNTLYEVEKSMVIGKAKMQKEMEERLNSLAQSFQEATNIRIADATHRAIRENVALNLELDAMYKISQELYTKMRDHKEKERNLRIHSSLFQSEAELALNKLLEQNRLIDKLAEDHYNMSLVHGKICREQAYRVTKEKIIQTYKEKTVEAQRKARILEQNIQKIKKDRENILKEMMDYCGRLKELENTFNVAKRFVTDIFQEEAPEEDVCTSCQEEFESKLQILMEILEKRIRIAEPVTMEVFKELDYSDESSSTEKSTVKRLKHQKINEEMGERDKSSTSRNTSETDQDPVKIAEEQTPEPEVPECLQSDSKSSDLTSPVETETPRSVLSTDM